jgi:glycosyltransferase involved in cell wall biosynthesis
VEDEPLVSVIIPTKNNEATIGKCLESLRAQTYPTIEVIVVDNYSADRTKSIAESFGFKVFLKGPERNPQRNFGAQQASGKYLLFIDSDMELSPEVVADCVAKMQNKDLQAVIIHEISFGEGFWTKCKALERSCYMGEATMELARFFSKDIFNRVNGFDVNLVGFDDRDLHFRIIASGGRVGTSDALIRHNEGKAGLMNLMRKKYLYGKSLHQYLSRHQSEGNIKWLFYRVTFIKHWGKLIRHPVLSLGIAFIQLCELSAAGAGFIVGSFKPFVWAKCS